MSTDGQVLVAAPKTRMLALLEKAGRNLLGANEQNAPIAAVRALFQN